MIDIVDIKADDIFMEKISTDAIWRKIDYPISNISLSGDATLRF